jgi:signal transduction histidine kinase
MQATQSNTASKSAISKKFAALRHVTRQMNINRDEKLAAPAAMVRPAEEVAPMVGVAEGAGLAHDAGNLLGALSLYSDLLAMPGVLHDEHRKYALELRMLSDRSWAMINRLVNHTWAGLPAIPQTELSMLPNVLEGCSGLLSRVAGRAVEISYGLGAFQPVRVPVESVERIATNLVKNAAEATPRGGPISMHVEGVIERAEGDDADQNAPRRRVVMTVRDRGCGMDPATIRRLMQFSGVPSHSGRGLGFRVVRELVAMSGGCISIDSKPGAGTSVSVEWYAVRQDKDDVQRSESGVIEAEVKSACKGEAGWITC